MAVLWAGELPSRQLNLGAAFGVGLTKGLQDELEVKKKLELLKETPEWKLAEAKLKFMEESPEYRALLMGVPAEIAAPEKIAQAAKMKVEALEGTETGRLQLEKARQEVEDVLRKKQALEAVGKVLTDPSVNPVDMREILKKFGDGITPESVLVAASVAAQFTNIQENLAKASYYKAAASEHLAKADVLRETSPLTKLMDETTIKSLRDIYKSTVDALYKAMDSYNSKLAQYPDLFKGDGRANVTMVLADNLLTITDQLSRNEFVQFGSLYDAYNSLNYAERQLRSVLEMKDISSRKNDDPVKAGLVKRLDAVIAKKREIENRAKAVSKEKDEQAVGEVTAEDVKKVRELSRLIEKLFGGSNATTKD